MMNSNESTRSQQEEEQAEEKEQNEQLRRKEVESLLRDEKECVTVSRLMTRFQISRSEASRLLWNIYQDQHEHQTATSEAPFYPTVVSSTSTETTTSNGDRVACTVFSFNSTKPDVEDFLYSLSPVSSADQNQQTGVLACCHEQSLAVWRDLLRERNVEKMRKCVRASQDMVLSLEGDELNSLWARYLQRHDSPVIPTTNISMVSSHDKVKKSTTMSASAFFGTNSSKTTSTAAMSDKKHPEEVLSRPPTKNQLQQPFAKKTDSVSQEKENDKNKLQLLKDKTTETSKTVGNADDFVGDMDDDDEDEEEEDDAVHVKQQQSTRKQEPPEKKKTKTVHHQSNIDKSKTGEVVDADISTDSAVTTTNKKESYTSKMEVEENIKSESPKRRPRRKQLMEKTTVDASGYLHTEIQEVWVDIPSDEEKDTPSISLQMAKKKMESHTKRKLNNNAAPKMKQGSLTAFFKK